jgi:hypothetical protein
MHEQFTAVPGEDAIEYFPLTEILWVTLWTTPEPENQMIKLVK